MADPSAPQPPSFIPRSLTTRALAALLFERIWPGVVLVLCCVALFVTASWLGLWLVLPAWAHAAALAAFAILALSSLVVALRIRWPDRKAVLARIDRDTGLPHRPISSADDSLANSDDPSTRALWDLHRRRMASALARARVAAPSPRVAVRDRFALRAAVVVAMVAAGFIAGPEKYGRLAAAFDWTNADLVSGTRIDAWIDPPAYTGKPPLVLLGQTRSTDTRAIITVPVGSSVIVRAAGADVVDVSASGALRPTAAAAQPRKSAEPGTVDKRYTLAGDGVLRITRGDAKPVVFQLQASPDTPPRIRLTDAPKPNARGTLALGYAIEDDYGVTGAEARFSNPIVRGRPVTGRMLVEPPPGPLVLPAQPGGLGEGKTTLDLSEHPWAGAQVTMTLSARDEGGNVGESAPQTLTLPAKPFSNPLARALVEQRRDLVLDPDHKEQVATALDAMQIAPDLFQVPLGIYLGLHTAQVRLATARTDAELIGVADFLWDMALRIENGDLNKTEQELRAAQKALRDAIDRGAPPDEIKRLTEALRQQMDKFVAEMMQNAERNQAQNESQSDRNSRTITQQDLKSMMDRMEDAARRGDTAEAQRLLDQLNSIMENLKSAKRSASQSQATRDMNRSMNDLNRMMRDQGDVRDKTFQRNQTGNDEQQGSSDDGSQDGSGAGQDQDGDQSGQQPGEGTGKAGQSGKSGPGFGQLRRRQQALGGQLDALQRKLRGLGMKGEQGFGDAQDAMKDAEGALGRGEGNDAVAAQGRALEGLQRGANGLSQQMAQGGQEGQQAQGQGGEQDGDPMQQGEDLDPLGRPRQGRGSTQGRDLDVSGGLAARAQQVLQELRRRLGDPTRSQDEQDYLERLLQHY